MQSAYLLGRIKPSMENTAISKIRELANISEASLVYGKYDLVVRVEVDKLENLELTVCDKIRKMEEIEDTQTLLVQ